MWIESHQSLRNHPKLLKLAAILNIIRAQCIGHLHLFWWWLCDYATNGDITKYDAGQIAQAAEWDGDPKQFLDALVEAGFIDVEGDSRRCHDWDEYRLYLHALQERKERQRNQIRRRVKRFRQRHGNGNVTPGNAPKKPSRTKLKKHNHPNQNLGGFENFWDMYPRKKSKEKAKEAWKELCPSHELQGRIFDALSKAKTSIEWTKDNGQFVPHPANWLTAKGWEDEYLQPGDTILSTCVHEIKDDASRFYRKCGKPVAEDQRGVPKPLCPDCLVLKAKERERLKELGAVV